MKCMVLGDTHGSKGEVKRAIARAKEYECNAIMQVGDFGFWEHQTAGFWYLEHLSRRAVEADIPFFWIDGNHENHTLLRAKYGPGGESHQPTPEGFWQIRPHLFYVPRGTKWEWGGLTMMGVGGAYSIDKEWRLQKEAESLGLYYQKFLASDHGYPHTLWWPEEKITFEEFEYVVSQGTADILFTHDCPSNAPFLHRLKPDAESVQHRQRMDEIGRSVQPRLWFHGHMHEYYNYSFPHESGEARVIGLECDGMQANWVIFDTAELFKEELTA